VKPINEPVSARVRLAIASWPDDAPWGSVSAFCSDQGISRKTFYAIRTRARTYGQAAALQPLSRKPKTSPKKIPVEVEDLAIGVRLALEESGLDHGPISVHDKMLSLGMVTPSVASLARIFRRTGISREEPRKRPRSAYRRFVYPVPNACWQLDSTEYVLQGGRKCVIFQLQDDHSRLAVASLVAWSETGKAALAVMKKGIAKHGIPQRLLTDNATAFNTSRRGWEAKLTTYVSSLGVQAITGKPGKPTTQGKNERFHQTLLKWLNKQPLVATIKELQDQVDHFDVIYNTQRPHQGLPGRITPMQAWQQTPPADPPLPKTPPITPTIYKTDRRRTPLTGEDTRTTDRAGKLMIASVTYMLGKAFANMQVHAIWDTNTVSFYTLDGEEIAVYKRPKDGSRYVSNNKPRGFMSRYEPKKSPKS
jgi:putative transposase